MWLANTIFGIPKEDFKTAVWCLVAGIIVAFVVIFFNKTVTGALVRALLDAGAIGEENAKTLAELGLDENTSFKNSYKRSKTIRGYIKTDKEVTEIAADTRMYIPEDVKARAEAQFALRGNELFIVIIGAVIAIAVGALVSILV